jgi:hypothetical protein
VVGFGDLRAAEGAIFGEALDKLAADHACSADDEDFQADDLQFEAPARNGLMKSIRVKSRPNYGAPFF